jgi:hypothetical protein
MQKMANRLALSIIIGATIVSLGMVVRTYLPPELETIGQIFFGAAFLFSVAFGIYIMWSIWKSGRT